MNINDLCKALYCHKDGYEITQQGKKTLIDIVSLVIDCSFNWFFQFNGKMNKNDFILSFDLSEFDAKYNEVKDRFTDMLDEISSLKFITHDGYMTMEITIPNFCSPLDLDD